MVQAKLQHDCTTELHDLNLRATPARIAILKFLEKAKEPIDISTIREYLNKNQLDTDPATIFRIMNTFTDKGITLPVQFQEGKTRYELTNKTHHHHLICEQCGKIEDVEVGIPELEARIEMKYNFLVKRHSLEFFGLCANCQK